MPVAWSNIQKFHWLFDYRQFLRSADMSIDFHRGSWIVKCSVRRNRQMQNSVVQFFVLINLDAMGGMLIS